MPNPPESAAPDAANESAPEAATESAPAAAGAPAPDLDPTPAPAPARKRCVGIMSGTSLDGIDVAIVDITGTGRGALLELVHAESIDFDPLLATLLAELVDEAGRSGRADLGLIARLQIRLAHEYAQAVRSALRGLPSGDGAPAGAATGAPSTTATGTATGTAAGTATGTAAPLPFVPHVVGCHGQTVYHAPEPETVAGIDVRGTIQLGDPSALAVLLGMTVVGDFRIADMALGGEGAPIVPYLDWCVLGSDDESRIALNLGGIANVTMLPAGCDRGDVRAFDTGPGNCLIDAASRKLHGRAFDRNGELAASGSSNDDLLRSWLEDPYFRRTPPKSTGREYFNAGYADRLVEQARAAGLSDADVLATITELTAASVADAVRRLTGASTPRRLLVSGGGVHNRAVMAGLERHLPGVAVESSAAYGLDPDAKEAVLCAFLAHEAMAGLATGMPSVTGASRPAVLGKICQGGQRTGAPR